jgi:8-oxo-dGTP diphosphatase
MKYIELIARAVIRKNDELLLAHKIVEPNTFLPGGHIEYAEYSDYALLRELHEELVINAEIKSFMGVQEYLFKQHGKSHHEINLIYEATISSEGESKEKGLEFLWCRLDQLEAKNLLPESLPKLIREYYKTGKIFHKIQ